MTLKSKFDKIKRKIILPFVTGTVMTAGGNGLQASPAKPERQSNSGNNIEIDISDQINFIYDNNPTYERKVRCNIYQMVEERSDWLCNEYVKSASRRLTAIKRCANKTSYVKNMFYRMGQGSKYDEYCLVAQLCAFKDVTDKTGNVQNVLPKSAQCSSFMQSLRNKGYGDCMRTNPGFKTMRPGDMVFTPRGGGKYHCTSVKNVWQDNKGKYHVLLNSFNNDRTYELGTGKTYIVVNMHKLISRSLWKEMVAKGIVASKMPQTDTDQILTLSEYNNIKNYLTQGMPEQKNKVADNIHNQPAESTEKPKQHVMTVWAMRNGREIG